MKGSDILNQLRQNANKAPEPTVQVTVAPDPQEPDDGPHEASDRCGLENGRYAQQGLIITDSQNIPLRLMYSGIQNSVAISCKDATDDDWFEWGFSGGPPDPLYQATLKTEYREQAVHLRNIIGNPFRRSSLLT